jgi:hypothetical protein
MKTMEIWDGKYKRKDAVGQTPFRKNLKYYNIEIYQQNNRFDYDGATFCMAGDYFTIEKYCDYEKYYYIDFLDDFKNKIDKLIIEWKAYQVYRKAYHDKQKLNSKELNTLSRSIEWACDYTIHVKMRRWIAVEKNILTSALYSYMYAKDVIKNRWIEAENLISNDAEIVFWYARDVIKGRWPEGEAAINKSEWHKKRYKNFLKQIKE